MNIRTRYARNGDDSVAYQVFGDGPVNLVFVPGFISNIENYWTEPSFARWLEHLGSFARVVMFDKRGTGLSDSIGGLAEMDERMDDVRVVMDAAGMDRVLATLLFTDIVDSTVQVAEFGDEHWRDLLQKHDRVVRDSISRHRGRFVKSTGNGVLAAFDGPARAVRCSLSIRDSVRDLGLEVRAGVHTGEIHVTADGDVQGISVHLAARIMDRAEAGSLLVSSTVRDLVAGSGLTFVEAGRHEFKGVPEEWTLHRVA